MKTVIDSIRYKLPLLVFALVTGFYAIAQDGSTTTSTETHTSNSSATTAPAVDPNAWYSQPWVWIAGIVVLIIILMMAFRGNNSSKSQVSRTYTTTTEVKND